MGRSDAQLVMRRTSKDANRGSNLQLVRRNNVQRQLDAAHYGKTDRWAATIFLQLGLASQ
jgi:hypothetical protein